MLSRPWCDRGAEDIEPGELVSHGICEHCFEAILETFEQTGTDPVELKWAA
jgi:hypothetical protein